MPWTSEHTKWLVDTGERSLLSVPGCTKVVKKEEKAVEFIPFGASDKLRLTATMVRQFIAVPTKSGAMPTERDCIRFIMLCRGKRANPFEGDAFLIGYDSKNGPLFSLVCGIELFMKRAQAQPEYDGAESGVIIKSEEGITERCGALVLDGEQLVGGWARVHRKDRTHPEYKSVKLETYNSNWSRWITDAPGMIAKVALSQALRGAYPTALGGLYTQEEMERVTETGEGLVEGRTDIEMPKRLSEQAAEVVEPEDKPEEPEYAEGEEPFEDPQEPTDIPEGAVKLQGVVAKITKKTGKKKSGEQFTRYGILLTDTDRGDQWVNTFSKTEGEEAEKLEGLLVDVIAMETKFGFDLIEIKPATVDGDAKEPDDEA